MTIKSPISRSLGLALALLPSLALANIGTVKTLEGEATRTPTGGAPVALKVGSDIELGDTLDVKSGNLAVALNDQSTLMLDAGSILKIEQARFENLERKAFSARLLVGTVWAKVTKALAGSNTDFEVTTERAVAGVRGTTFVVEVEGDQERATHVKVIEGRVDVMAKEPLSPPAATVPMAVALSKPGVPAQNGAAPAESAAARARAVTPPAAPRIESLGAGEGLAVRANRIERETRALPERFERFIHAHENDAREPGREQRPGLEHRPAERIRERLNNGPGRRRL